MTVVDYGSDLHTHSSQTDGADPMDAMADAALAAGLHTWGLSDHVRSDTTWLPDYTRAVRGLRREGLVIRCGVEAKILDVGGRLDLPERLPELDYVLIADHQFPGDAGPQHPSVMREALESGSLTASDMVAQLVHATAAAVRLSPFPAIVAHLFSLLPKCGVDESDVTDEAIGELAAVCLSADAAVELNQKWRCPSARVVARLDAAGVRLVAGSDAHRAADVGRFTSPPETVATS